MDYSLEFSKAVRALEFKSLPLVRYLRFVIRPLVLHLASWVWQGGA
jgi:hypothetical protein